MGDAAVDSWELEGRLHVWHYPKPVKNLEGWHLNADTAACKSMADLVDRMLAAEWQTHKRIPVSVPRRMLVARWQPWEPASALLLRCPKDQVEDTFWHAELTEGNVLALTVGTAKLRDVQKSLLGLPKWKDDFALGPDVDWKRRNNHAERARFGSECLWFWTKVE
jgi:hypothetical protein